MKKAIVLGGTHDHIRLIEILKERGYYTILIDYYPNPPAKIHADEHVQESILDLEKVKSIAIEKEPQLIVAVCIDQALLIIASICEALGLPCQISYQTALELTNKVYMKRRLQEIKVPTSRFVILESGEKLENFDLKFPIVVKPADANSSKGISKVLNAEGMDAAMSIAYAYTRSSKIVLEEFVEGEELSVDVVIKNFEPTIIMTSINKKLQQNKDNFTIVKNIYFGEIPPVVLYKIKDIARSIAGAYGIKNGPMLMQLIMSGEDVSVIEFSSRVGGGSKHHFIRRMTGFDIINWCVDNLDGKVQDVEIKQPYTLGCMNYVYAHNGTIQQFDGFEALKNKGVIEDYFYYKTVGMTIENHIASTDRPAGYMIADNDAERFEEKEKEARENIRVLDASGNNLVL